MHHPKRDFADVNSEINGQLGHLDFVQSHLLSRFVHLVFDELDLKVVVQIVQLEVVEAGEEGEQREVDGEGRGQEEG